MSLNGHDKLCGYQNSTFPLCIYGGQDTYSGKIMFLQIIGRFYLEYLFTSQGRQKFLVNIYVDFKV